jgi:hypothetical protein
LEISGMTAQQESVPPFWNAKSGVFDPAQLRLAIVLRRWTVTEFARASRVSPACLYNALKGCGVTDRTAIRIFQGLAMREPTRLLP